MTKMKRVKVVERHLGREKAFGLAYPDGLVELDPRQDSREYLDTLIHEILHVIEPKWSEDAIWDAANVLSSKIWKANYRRIRK
jgi:hypothetical protein